MENNMKHIIDSAVRDGSDQAAMEKVPSLLEALNAMNALWSNPAALAEALKPVTKVMDQVTAFVNNPENHNGRS